MRPIQRPGGSEGAQTFVFFALTLTTLFLLCGLAIDSGLLFLAKARMSRAVDGASLAAVGNFHQSTDPATNRANVATIMRNFATANYTDLNVYPHAISTTSPEVATPYTTPTGQTAYNYTYNFNDGTKDANGQYRRFVEVVLQTGAGGQITSATCNSRCPVNTHFIGFLGPAFKDLKVSSSSVATRNPRLIMIVLDRSGSMLAAGPNGVGGAYGLPNAVVQFLDFFDTSADYIGIVSFGSNARLEMPLTTNFIIAGTNVLFDAYQTNGFIGTPGVDPEQYITNTGGYDPNYATSGVRRLKFGGLTAADEGFRLAMEQLMANVGFNNPDVVKYLVLFTDGAWNQTRTLVAAPGYTNWVIGPPPGDTTIVATNSSPWSTDLSQDGNIIPVPTLSPQPGLTAAINANRTVYFPTLATYHTNDVWQSYDGTNEPIPANGAAPPYALTPKVGAPMTVTNSSFLTNDDLGNPVYARYIDVWLQPGAVDYEWHNNEITNVYVSDLTNPTQHVQVLQQSGDSNELVVPGYLVDGLLYDGLDLTFKDNTANAGSLPPSPWPHYRYNNYQEYLMWPDDTVFDGTSTTASNWSTGNSFERQLMFRNYVNLLTGFYVTRPDDPLGASTDIDPFTGAQRPLNGLGPYYPGAGFYWPFDKVGVDVYQSYSLTNAINDPDPLHNLSPNKGGSRHGSYSINMQSSAAAPSWCGEWFFCGTQGTGVYSSPGNTTISTMMTSKQMWQSNAPSWVLADFDAAGEGITTNESAHNTNVIQTADVWRPTSFSGVLLGQTNFTTTASDIISNDFSHGGSVTGGYVMDGATGKIYKNSMAWSGRPTHYFDFSKSKWVPVISNHIENLQALPLGYWKVQEYAWHARAMGVTIFSVGYGSLVTPDQQVVLAQVANSTNTTAGNAQGTVSGTFTYTDTGGTAINYNPSQPIGRQFFATTPDEISNDFYQVGQAINAALTQ